jgi:hypothetical protein
MLRRHIINKLIEKNNYKSYVEIGVRKGWTFRKINCSKKVGVDPDPRPDVTHVMTSDEFFMINKEKFDIFFIDGLHEKVQVLRDIENALHFLNDGGTVVCHDMNPTTKEMQEVPRNQTEWTGDGWKAWVVLRQTRNDLTMHVIDTDYGVGVIHFGGQKLLPPIERLKYESLEKHRKEWLNLISEEEFLKLYT